MKQSSVGFLLLGVLAILIVDQAQVSSMSMPEFAQQCDPEYLQQIDSPKIKKICNFLQNYAQAMQTYNKETGPGFNSMQYGDMMENGVKRQDVDHVFLRFGRKRR